MSFVYTEESLKKMGYAGVPTTRISELVHGYQFDPQAPRSRGLATDLSKSPVAGVPSDILPARGVRTGKSCCNFRTWDTAGLPSETLNSATSLEGRAAGKAGNKNFDSSLGSVFPWKDAEANTDAALLKKKPRLGDFRRRIATVQEEKTRFSKTYICTDKKAGRTEIMTARRCGAAHLDLDLNHFDVYASHEGHRLLGQSELNYDKENLETGLIPISELKFRPGKALHVRPFDSVNMSQNFSKSVPETRRRQTLGYLRRKIAAEWSRSNKSCFCLAEGYQPMHWRISPEKPLVNVSYYPSVPGLERISANCLTSSVEKLSSRKE